ncbi:MAG: LysR family transcriptional regulator, partial [Myxococcota bacterium]
LKASTALGMSRATLRAKISALEESLNANLMVRTHRGVLSTEFGTTFAARAKSLLREADALVSLATTRDEVNGVFRVYLPAGLPPAVGAVFAMELRRRYPGLEVHLEVATGMGDALPLDGDLAVYFGATAPAGPFRTFSVLRFPEVLLASGAYLAAHGRPERVDDLANHSLLSWRPPGDDGTAWPLVQGGTVSVKPFLVTPYAYLVRVLVAAGQGIALLPDAEVAQSTVPGTDIEVVLPEVIGRECALRVLIPETQAASARSRAVVAVLRQVIAGPGPAQLELAKFLGLA